MSEPASPKKTVLITGCSDGSLGAALAIGFRNAGLHVYATSRNPAKMAGLIALGIEIFALDVLD
jgi:NAD(P)-dependent dehydrogenase (short-subunit alcohol dehydrogenase family)